MKDLQFHVKIMTNVKYSLTNVNYYSELINVM